MTNTYMAISLLALLNTPAVFGAPPNETTPFGSTWAGVGFVMGYGNEAAYIKYACGGTDPGSSAECDGPPRVGLSRNLTQIVDGIMEGLKYTKCSQIPQNGASDASVTTSKVTATVSYKTPLHKIPAGWTGGGTAFDRRMEMTFNFVGQTVKANIEIACGYEQTGMIAINMAVGSNATGYERPILLWTGKKDGLEVADIYTVEKNASNHVRGVYAYSLTIDEANKAYTLSGAQSTHFQTANTAAIDLFNAAGNFSTHKISMRTKRFVITKEGSSPNRIDADGALAAMTGASDALLANATGFSLLTDTQISTNGPVDTVQGCMDFDEDSTAPTSAAACTGLAYPTSVSAPVIDAEGKFSPNWILNSLKTKISDYVPTL